MPLIYCPKCSRITYAYPYYNKIGETIGYRCSECYGVFHVGDVNVAEFPSETIVLNDTFINIIAEETGKTPDEVLDSAENPVEDFYRLLKSKIPGLRILKHKDAYWDYRGTREADIYNDALLEELQQFFADAINRNHIVVEITEPDEGNSLFIAIPPNDLNTLHRFLAKYIRQTISSEKLLASL